MKKSNFITGIFFIAIAIVILLNQLNMFSVGFGFWTIFLGICFGCTMAKSIVDRNVPGIFFSGAFLWMVFQGPLEMPHIGVFPLLMIALMLSIGWGFLFPKMSNNYRHNHKNYSAYDNVNEKGEYQHINNNENSSNIFFSNRFGATAKYVNCPDFQHGFIKNEFGSTQVYFDNAKINISNATLEIDDNFGETELFIPRNWNVVHSIRIFAGNVSERNRLQNPTGPTLHITGRVNFGEVVIIYI